MSQSSSYEYLRYVDKEINFINGENFRMQKRLSTIGNNLLELAAFLCLLNMETPRTDYS